MKLTLVTTASDKTKLYSHKKAEKVFLKLKSKKFSIRDLVLILLYAQDKPLHGRTLLTKELFLLYKSILFEKSQDPKFVKYRLGPYSFHLMEMISTSSSDGLIQVKGRRNSNSESFRLTQKGKKYAKKIFNEVSASTRKEIIQKTKGMGPTWHSWNSELCLYSLPLIQSKLHSKEKIQRYHLGHINEN